jgi:hypothetical protein
LTKRDKINGPKTIDEVMSALESDPAWVEMRRARGLKREEFARLLQEQERELVRELASVGVHVKEVSDLVNTRAAYPAAIPVLIKHLPKPYHQNIGDMIARALAVPEARFAWDFIVAQYVKEPSLRSDGGNNYKKDGLALAVANALPLDRWDDFIAIVREKANGDSRLMMLRRIEKSGRPETDELLNELAKETIFAYEIGQIRKRQERTRQRRELAKDKNSLH